MAGASVGRYELEELVSRGGMGEVWRARDLTLGRFVAIKLLYSELGEAVEGERFLREARAAARLSHPNIVATYDVGHWDGRPYLVMEYLDGPSIANDLQERYWLPAAEIRQIGAQVASALACAHAAGVIHRDIKPGNLVKTGEGTVKLVDFGLAWLVNESGRRRLTPDGTAMGTTFYLAPEVAVGKKVDERSDLYSLGCVLYELACGRPPFEGAMPEVIMAHLHNEPEPPSHVRPDLPHDLEALILHLLAKQPEHRPADAASVNLTLRNLVGTLQLPAADPPGAVSSWSGPPTQPQSRRPRLLVGATAAVTLAALAAWWALPFPGDGREQAGQPEQPRPTAQNTTPPPNTPTSRPITGDIRPSQSPSSPSLSPVDENQRTTSTKAGRDKANPGKPDKKGGKKTGKPDKAKPGKSKNGA